MKAKRTFSFFFSLLVVLGMAQETEITDKPDWKYEPNFMVGFDLLNAGLSFFSERKVYQGFVSSRLIRELHVVADAGFERNIYVKNGYDAEAKGPYVKLGSLYRLMKDPENRLNGFYAGGKLAASFYKQEYRAVPVRGFGGSSSFEAFPSSGQSTYWIEGAAGGRVQLFESNFYIEVNIQPKYLIYTTKQEDIQPMIVPGFGRSSGKFNMGYMWNIAYSF
jgi:hypothetical protein